MKSIARVFLFVGLLLTVGATSVSAASPSTVVSAPSAALTRVGWTSYLNHTIAYLDKAGDDSDDIIFALDYLDIPDIAAAYLPARNHARAEVRWLATHRPAACFAKLYAIDKVIAHYKDVAYSNLYTYWHGYPNASQATFDRGLKYLGMATAKTKSSTRILNNTRC